MLAGWFDTALVPQKIVVVCRCRQLAKRHGVLAHVSCKLGLLLFASGEAKMGS